MFNAFWYLLFPKNYASRLEARQKLEQKDAVLAPL